MTHSDGPREALLRGALRRPPRRGGNIRGGGRRWGVREHRSLDRRRRRRAGAGLRAVARRDRRPLPRHPRRTPLAGRRRRGAGRSRRRPPAPSSWPPSARALGERATLLQFSSAFCAPCRATRRVLDEVTGLVEGVAHVEVDAEHHLEATRAFGILRTPTTVVLDASRRRGHPGDGRAHPRPGADARWRRRDLTIWMQGPHRETRARWSSRDAYCRRHVLDHAHQAPRSGSLPRALGAVSNVLTGPPLTSSI